MDIVGLYKIMYLNNCCIIAAYEYKSRLVSVLHLALSRDLFYSLCAIDLRIKVKLEHGKKSAIICHSWPVLMRALWPLTVLCDIVGIQPGCQINTVEAAILWAEPIFLVFFSL